MKLATPPLDFMVLALPRSGSTWVANFLTGDRTLCLHDPFELGMPGEWPSDHRLRGICCTGAALMPHWRSAYRCPVAILTRDPADCDASLARLGLPDTTTYRGALAAAQGRRFAFPSLWTEDGARALWEYLLPAKLPFDAIRYRELRRMQVQPMGRPAYDAATATELIGAGLLEGRL